MNERNENQSLRLHGGPKEFVLEDEKNKKIKQKKHIHEENNGIDCKDQDWLEEEEEEEEEEEDLHELAPER